MKITHTRQSSIFAVALFAVMPTAIMTQSFTNYIGDFYFSILLMLALWFILTYLENKKLPYLAAGGIMAFFTLNMWAGGMFAVVALIFAGIIILLQGKIGFQRAIMLGFIAVMGAYFFIYPISMFYVGPDLSNINAASEFQVPSLNFITLITQQNLVWHTSLTMTIGQYSGGFFLFMFPILLLALVESKRNIWTVTVFGMFLAGLPIALVNARFESLIIIPMAILAAGGTKLMKIPYKIDVYLILLGIMAFFAIYEVWTVWLYF